HADTLELESKKTKSDEDVDVDVSNPSELALNKEEEKNESEKLEETPPISACTKCEKLREERRKIVEEFLMSDEKIAQLPPISCMDNAKKLHKLDTASMTRPKLEEHAKRLEGLVEELLKCLHHEEMEYENMRTRLMAICDRTSSRKELGGMSVRERNVSE
ncbi:hypothetical protein PFISCL1PPCAC_28106, partial [Pristionchus fissidentatus]